MGRNEQGQFFKRLGEMLGRGFSLAEAIEFLSRIHSGREPVFRAILADLHEGVPVHEAFYRQGFDSRTCAKLFFADKHGFLALALQDSGDYLLRLQHEKKKMSKLLRYPSLLMAIFLFSAILLKFFLLPHFVSLYSSLGYKPAWTVGLLLWLSDHLLIILSVAALSGIIALRFILSSLRSRTAIQKAGILSRIPVLGVYSQLLIHQFIAREWSFLLKSGFSMIEAFEIMRSQSYRPLLKELAAHLHDRLLRGDALPDAMADTHILGSSLKEIVLHGEANGRLDQELMYYSDYCMGVLEAKAEKQFQMLQPLAFTLIGAMIISVYVSILVPMFQIIDMI